MTRDNPTSQKSSRSLYAAQFASSTHQNQNHHQQHHHHHKVVQFEPFHLLSFDDGSLKQAIETVESASLNRFKVCVISIVSKDSIDGVVQRQLVHSIINTNRSDKRRGKGKQNAKSNTNEQQEATSIPDDRNKSNKPACRYANQVTGHVDTKTDVIVLNLTSFMNTVNLNQFYEVASELESIDKTETQTLLSKIWPKLNQQLVKILLILFLMSHIVVFYNPEPTIDYSLIQTFKVLETLRQKSQYRIADLLETIASKQMFSQSWIRQGRVSCPRALFVCDTSYLGVSLNQIDVVNLKKDLEDQIYKLLKRTNIIRPTTSSQSCLMTLPERDDFVFVISKHDPRPKESSHGVAEGDLIVELNQREEFYSSLFESLGISQKENDVKNKIENDQKVMNQPATDNIDHLSQDENESTNIQENLVQNKTSMAIQQHRFRKFLNKHISDIQALQIDQDTKNTNLGSPGNLVFPRYDDFFTVLSRLKNLLFPNTVVANEHHQQSTDLSKANMAKHFIDEQPDERKFVDIYDLINTDELFSKKHCYKTRMAAFDYYCRDVRVQSGNHQINGSHHDNVLSSAKKLFLNHARGLACASNLELLIDQCNQYWRDSSFAKPSIDDAKEGRLFRSNRISKTISSDVVPSPHSSSQSSMQNSKVSLSIARRANGVKVTTSCDCGRLVNFMVSPVDRKKKLERVDINRVVD